MGELNIPTAALVAIIIILICFVLVLAAAMRSLGSKRHRKEQMAPAKSMTKRLSRTMKFSLPSLHTPRASAIKGDMTGEEFPFPNQDLRKSWAENPGSKLPSYSSRKPSRTSLRRSPAASSIRGDALEDDMPPSRARSRPSSFYVHARSARTFSDNVSSYDTSQQEAMLMSALVPKLLTQVYQPQLSQSPVWL